MSSIDVSIGDISSVEKELRKLSDDIRIGKENVISVASHLDGKVSATISYTSDKITTMLNDKSAALYAIKVNEEAKKQAQSVVNQLKKEQARANEAYQQAKENQTNVKNSSSGSTEEEKKAHNAAVKSANSAVNSASSNLNSIKKQVDSAQNNVNNIQMMIDKLTDIIIDIGRSHDGARAFLEKVKLDYSGFKLVKGTFIDKATKAENMVNEVIVSVDKAKQYIEKALKHFAEACDCAAASRVRMYGTAPITKSINMLIDAKNRISEMTKSVVKSSTVYNTDLGSDVSEIANQKIKEITGIMVKQTEDYNRIIEHFKYAKSNLDSYLSLE